jgi:hypothetical protein
MQPPFVPGYADPELIVLRARPQTIGQGPSNARMYVADALTKRYPYSFPYLPPGHDACTSGVSPGPEGHFDHLLPGTRAFGSAQLFATVALVLDVWEAYWGKAMPWHFYQPQLELVPYLDWGNAHAGYGFLETGFGAAPDGTLWPYAMSFDVVAHEVGHLILYSTLGLPDPDLAGPQFGGFHEATADLVSIVSLLHMPGMISRVLEHTEGDFYGANEVSRFGELSPSAEIRRADNRLTLREVEGTDIHRLSMVLTGAIFDILVEAFLLNLSLLGTIDNLDVARARAAGQRSQSDPVVAQRLASALSTSRATFERALSGARDFVGRRMALSWRILKPEELTYATAAWAFLQADSALKGDTGNETWILSNFTWRGITPSAPRQPGLRSYPKALRRIRGYPEPTEMQHSCALRHLRT